MPKQTKKEDIDRVAGEEELLRNTFVNAQMLGLDSDEEDDQNSDSQGAKNDLQLWKQQMLKDMEKKPKKANDSTSSAGICWIDTKRPDKKLITEEYYPEDFVNAVLKDKNDARGSPRGNFASGSSFDDAFDNLTGIASGVNHHRQRTNSLTGNENGKILDGDKDDKR